MAVLLALIAMFAIAGIVVVGLSQKLSSQEKQSHQQPSNQHTAGDHAKTGNEDSKITGWTKIREAIEHNEKVITALSTAVIAAFTVALVLATGFLWFSSEKVADSAKQSADIAKDTLVATQRPWIKLSEVKVGPLAFDAQEGRITVFVRAANIGVAPAMNVRLGAMAYLQIDVGKAQKTFCDTFREVKVESGPALFPSDDLPLSISIPISRADIDQFGLEVEISGQNRRAISPIIIGCVDYVLPIDKSHRQTQFAYSLSENRNGEAFVIYADSPIPADRLLLTRWIMGGFSAD